MSRAALWRQESNLKERERQANETFENAVEEGRNRPLKGLIPLKEDTTTFNLNPMLLGNISKSGYFLKACNEVKEWTTLVDEIYYHVKHMEPWQGSAKTPSTAFCLLLRLFTLRCSEKQMKLMLDHVDSPYIRCTGFLYLRYAADPSIIYKWFQPYLYDNEPVKIRASMSCKEITVGDFVRDLLNDLNYYTTRLPRLPIGIEREIKVKLLEEQQCEERAQRHLKDKMVMEHFERVGSKVQAMYGDEENEVTWYDAVVDRVVRKDDDTGIDLFIPKFMVTFPEYENTEVVTLGAMDMPGVDHSVPTQPRAVGRDATYSSGGGGGGRRDDRGRNGDQTRGYDYDRHRNDSDRGRGRNDERYSRRTDDRDVRRGHGSTQSSYSSRGYDNRDRDTRNRRDRSRSRDQALPGRSAGNDRSDSGPDRGSNDHSAGRHGDSRGGDNHADASAARSPPRKTRQELAVVADKKRKLLAKYG